MECTTTSAPSAERLLQVRAWRRCCRPTSSAPASCASSASAAMSATPSSGLVGVSHQTIRVAGRSAARTASRSPSGAGVNSSPQRVEHLREQAVRAAVRVVRDDDVVARAAAVRSRVSSAASPLANASPVRPPSSAARQVSSAVRVGLPRCASTRSRACSPDRALRVGGRLVDRHGDRAVAGRVPGRRGSRGCRTRQASGGLARRFGCSRAASVDADATPGDGPATAGAVSVGEEARARRSG